MTYEMEDKDVHGAAAALIAWVESQDINPSDAVRVLITALVSIIHQISVERGLSAKEGGRVIADIIVELLP